MSPDEDRPSLLRQLMGAAIGGSLALGLYYGYEFASPHLTAVLSIPVPESGMRQVSAGVTRIADNTLEQDEYIRLQSRAARIAADFGDKTENPADYKLPDTAMEIEWPDAPDAPDILPIQDPMEEVMEDEENLIDAWEGFPWDTIDSQEPDAPEEVIASEAPVLPDSGFGLSLALISAVSGAAAVRYRKRFAKKE